MASRGARRTAATCIAVWAAAVVVGAPGCGGSSDPDPYTRAAERICATAKAKLVRLERAYRRGPDHADPRPLAHSMFTIVGDERARLAALKPPPARAVEAVELDQALLEFENRLTDVIHLETPRRGEDLPVDRGADAAGEQAGKVAAQLSLATCAALPLAISPSVSLG